MLKSLVCISLIALSASTALAGQPGLRAFYYNYNYGQTATSANDPNQHVICDDCPPLVSVTPYKHMATIGMNGHVIIPVAPERRIVESMASAKSSEKDSSATHSVLFPFDGRVVSSEEKHSLGIFLEGMNRDAKINIEGHTCDIGPKAYNLVLSRKRAEAVAKIVRSKGLPLGKISGVGDASPTGKGHKADRRAEVSL